MRPLSAGGRLGLGTSWWCAGAGGMQCNGLTLYNVYIGEHLLTRDLAAVTRDAALCRLLWTGPRDEAEGVVHETIGREPLHDCAALLKAMTSAKPLAACGLFLQLLELLREAMDLDRTRRASDEPALHPAVLASTAAMESAIDEDWSLDELATSAEIDGSYLVRLFGKHLNTTPMRYLNRLRMQKAAALLLSTDLPVGDIGAAVGIFDANYFARRFRSYFGVSPTSFRAAK